MNAFFWQSQFLGSGTEERCRPTQVPRVARQKDTQTQTGSAGKRGAASRKNPKMAPVVVCTRCPSVWACDYLAFSDCLGRLRKYGLPGGSSEFSKDSPHFSASSYSLIRELSTLSCSTSMPTCWHTSHNDRLWRSGTEAHINPSFYSCLGHTFYHSNRENSITGDSAATEMMLRDKWIT